MAEIKSLADIDRIKMNPNRQLYSASEQEILDGYTTDVYFVRTLDILDSMGLADKVVTAEIFARKPGVFAGIDEAFNT